MKKALVAAILGIALNVTTSHGQGFIVFENYVVATGGIPVWSGVTYAPGSPKAGQYVGAASGFKADLLVSLNGGTSYSLVSGSQTPFYGTFNGQPSNSQDGGTPTTDGAGSFIGPKVTIPGYTSGAVNFIVEAYNGSSFGQIGQFNGQSAPFTINSLTTDPLATPGNIMNLSGTTATGLQPFVVSVPEPSIFALAGLGAAGLMAFRRKK
jgi:PEP-CTERM motif